MLNTESETNEYTHMIQLIQSFRTSKTYMWFSNCACNCSEDREERGKRKYRVVKKNVLYLSRGVKGKMLTMDRKKL